MFVQFLANTHKSPSTVKNYISGAQYWLRHHNGDDSAFLSHGASSVLKYNINASKHVPFKAPPLTPLIIYNICQYVDSVISFPPAFKAALLIGYSCFLRASNLLAPSAANPLGNHTLTTMDIAIQPPGLQVCVRSSKTIRDSNPVFLPVCYGSNLSTCPVRTWANYVRDVNPYPSGPAFVIDPFTPLSTKPFVDLLRLALMAIGVTNSNHYSIHSFRRGAAQAADAAGAAKDEIKLHGTWKSDSAFYAYIPKKL